MAFKIHTVKVLKAKKKQFSEQDELIQKKNSKRKALNIQCAIFVIAIEAKYHIKFLLILRNRYRTLRTFIRSSREPFSTEEKISESIALVELFNLGTLLFRLSE